MKEVVLHSRACSLKIQVAQNECPPLVYDARPKSQPNKSWFRRMNNNGWTSVESYCILL